MKQQSIKPLILKQPKTPYFPALKHSTNENINTPKNTYSNPQITKVKRAHSKFKSINQAPPSKSILQ